ncbi:hypothetical protein ELH01_10075 [Rhizobium ruizarguesonis]|nr:hypothetical protein ELH12_09145 [Rhizobium ruizarguesonis]TBE77526.1 hypothetical protein ELH01_10075 [Rhizobium ruizarguesonis]TBE87006.1 hypothetical protein ELG99_09145 [Rhizobium ruizarguesonis]
MTPGEAITQIVPNNDALTPELRLSPQDIPVSVLCISYASCASAGRGPARPSKAAPKIKCRTELMKPTPETAIHARSPTSRKSPGNGRCNRVNINPPKTDR